MVLPANVVRAAINATLINGETMVHTMHFQGSALNSTQAGLTLVAQDISDAFEQFLNAPGGGGTTLVKSSISAGTTYTSVDCYLLGPTGTSILQAAFPFAPGTVGTGTGGPLPHEVAACISFRTAIPGKRTRGRLFLGGLDRTLVAGDGEMATDRPPLISQSLATTFGVLQSGVRPLDPVVLSTVALTVQPITQIGMGRVFDVQRRRRRSIPELKVFFPVP
jgi:hypothetical protein